MSEKFEPKPYTEEQLKHEKTRALETADLIKKGDAEFIDTPEGPILSVPEKHQARIAAEEDLRKRYEEERRKNEEKYRIEQEKREKEFNALKEFNKQSETIRDPELVSDRISNYFRDTEGYEKEIEEHLSKTDALQFKNSLIVLREIANQLKYGKAFDCCFWDDLDNIHYRVLREGLGYDDARIKPQKSPEKILPGVVLSRNRFRTEFLQKFSDDQTVFESANPETQEKIDAIFLKLRLELLRNAVKKSHEGTHSYPFKGIHRPFFEEGRGEFPETAAVQLSKRLGLGTPETYREISAGLYEKESERDKGYQAFLEILELKNSEK